MLEELKNQDTAMRIKPFGFTNYLCLGVFWAAWVLSGCSSEKKDRTKPSYRKVTEVVFSTGQIEPQHFHTIRSEVSGRVTQIAKESGAILPPNTMILLLKDKVAQQELKLAQEEYAYAKENASHASATLQELQQRIELAKEKLANDSANLKRYSNLMEQNATTPQQYDQAKLAYESARSNLKSLEKQYENLKAELQLNLKRAARKKKIAAEQASHFQVRTQDTSKVYKVYPSEGATVTIGEPLVQLGHPARYVLKLEVDETDIKKVKKGMEVLYQIEGEDSLRQATLSKVSAAPEQNSNYYAVEAMPKQKLENIPAGITVEANIIIQKKEQVLTLPASYITEEDSVLVLTSEEKEQWVKVETGISDMQYVEVRSGVDSSQTILMP